MLNSDLDAVYQKNLGTSHEAGLRGVFDAGYQVGIAQVPTPSTPDESVIVSVTVALADTPTISVP